MIIELNEIKKYQDDRNNAIEYEGPANKNATITFKGKNNKLIIDKTARIKFLKVGFMCNNAIVKIGGLGSVSLELQMGEDCSIDVGNNCAFTAKCYMTTAEGTSITMGESCIVGVGVAVRTNDSHPIFDVHTGKRINTSKDVKIGNHVWLGERVTVQKGSWIGDGSVIGIASIVTTAIPNNCIAVGIPAKIVKRDIAWEPPHLVHVEPYYKPDDSCVKKSKYWNPTED